MGAIKGMSLIWKYICYLGLLLSLSTQRVDMPVHPRASIQRTKKYMYCSSQHTAKDRKQNWLSFREIKILKEQ